MKKLARLMCRFEKGKRQVDIAQMNEVLRKLAVIRAVGWATDNKSIVSAVNEYTLCWTALINTARVLELQGYAPAQILRRMMDKPKKRVADGLKKSLKEAVGMKRKANK